MAAKQLLDEACFACTTKLRWQPLQVRTERERRLAEKHYLEDKAAVQQTWHWQAAATMHIIPAFCRQHCPHYTTSGAAALCETVPEVLSASSLKSSGSGCCQICEDQIKKLKNEIKDLRCWPYVSVRVTLGLIFLQSLQEELEEQQTATPALDHEKEKLKASVGHQMAPNSCG